VSAERRSASAAPPSVDAAGAADAVRYHHHNQIDIISGFWSSVVDA
jgi:hypothetical protein